MGVLEFLCDCRFHKSFLLPPNPDSGRDKPFRVSYSDYGDATSDAVILICGALMATRLSYSTLDQIAKEAHVRIIHPDRPGVGGTEAVDIHERIAVWIEIVPQLLSHLDIQHVSLASHSGGDIYLLNTMLKYPHLLHPKSPYVCFFAPWVHYSHSKVGQMMATQLLPSPLIGKFATVAKFVNNNVVPLAGMSSGLFHGLKGSMMPSTPEPAPVLLDPSAPASASRTSISSRSGLFDMDLDDPKQVDELRKLVPIYLFAESTDGISSDAQIFLKHPHTLSWSLPNMDWSDINEFVPLITKIIEEDRKHDRNWTIDVFHAEDDNMVGEKGKQWWDECWGPRQASSDIEDEGQPRPSYNYNSETVKGTEHNYLMDPVYGASQIWLERVRGAFPPPSEV